MIMTKPSITFDQCIPLLTQALCDALPEVDLSNLRVVRDMHGYLFLVVPDGWSDETLNALRSQLHEALGPYSPGRESGVAKYSETLAGEALLKEPCLVQWVGDAGVRIIERRAMGQDWVLHPASGDSTHPPRFVFHSLKGGVGRSTALMLWGRELARQGRTVLVIDLDLEAPGLGAHMLPDHARPEYGVLDWLVEDLVGNSTRSLPVDMIGESPLVESPGLWVAPAQGRHSLAHAGNTLAKLARAYLEREDGGSFGTRLQRMISALEAQTQPDVVLIDSRAGLHETVAANLLHLQAEVFFFAVDVPATWEGYRYLFAHLAQLATVSDATSSDMDWRQRFHMVQARSSMREADKRRFAANAYSVWLDTLYDALPAKVETAAPGEAFTFDELDPQAPHWPLAILRSDHFEAFDPLEQLSEIGEHAIREAFGELFAGLQSCLQLLEEKSE